MAKRIKINEIRDYLNNLGFELLSEKVPNVRTSIKIRCNNGHIYNITFAGFKLTNKCPYCSGKRLTIDMIREKVNDVGYELLSSKYINNREKMKFKCNQGHIYKTSWTVFNDGGRCPECNRIDIIKRQTNSYDYVKSIIEVESKTGYKLLSENYVNNETPLKMMCDNGHDIEMAFGNFINGRRCKYCNKKNRKYKTTKEEREANRTIEGYKEWVYSVFERDNYTCQCCGTIGNGNLNSHHLDGYNWCNERRIDVSNGVTLCEDCHINFHLDYGFGDNKESQFLAWIHENGIGIFNIDSVKLNSVLLNKPKKKEVLDCKEYMRQYYLKNGQKYSYIELDELIKDTISKYSNPQYFTTKGFKEVSGINPIVITKVFKMEWIDVLEKYNKKQDVFEYIKSEFYKHYRNTGKIGVYIFSKNHKYITEHLVRQFGEYEIKSILYNAS